MMTTTTLNIEQLFSKTGSPSYPFYDNQGQLCWLESLVDQNGRIALKQQAKKGERVVTPENYQIRTKVHEYGGHCFCVVDGRIYFNNYSDGQIYRQSLDDNSPPLLLSIKDSLPVAYADLRYIPAWHAIVAVQEIWRPEGNENRLVYFNLDKDKAAQAQILQQGADFYASPCVSSKGDQLAWMQWSHPYMPWDETSLMVAPVGLAKQSKDVGSSKLIAGGKDTSICQVGYLDNDDLVFAMDSKTKQDSSKNYWNLYCFNGSKTSQLTKGKAEYGEAHWVFGQRRWIQIDKNTILAIATQHGQDQLICVNYQTKNAQPLGKPYAGISQLNFSQGRVVGVAYSMGRVAEVFGLKSSHWQVLKQAESWIGKNEVSIAQIIQYATHDNQYAFANFYPANKTTSRQKSAMIVFVHGGPTSRADMALKPMVQYFCQQGFAVLDINHRGSTGYGRSYRQSLLGKWGEIDCDDIADAITEITKQQAIDSTQVFIRGGSAGGYAVLRALTRYPDLFRAGACYYGIGNLITLAKITHKFEAHYADRLIGEVYNVKRAVQPDSRFVTRSPIFDIASIKSPLILFQGLDDKVVPPAVSQEMACTLQRNGVAHKYIEYLGEGHGFRQASTKIDALKHEIAFYRAVDKT